MKTRPAKRNAPTVGRRSQHGAAVKEVAHIIERHDDHDQAAERVDGGQPFHDRHYRGSVPFET